MIKDRKSEILVVGGGVIGCAIAYYLVKHGVSVTLIERGDIGGESTGASAGIIAPLLEASEPGPFLDLAMISLKMYSDLAGALAEEANIDISYRPTGALYIALSEENKQTLRTKFDWQCSTNLSLHWLNESEVRALEPNLTDEVRAAILSEDEGQLEPGKLAQALATAARRRGCDIQTRVAVREFKTYRNRVGTVITSAGSISCQKLVLASGAWTRRLARQLNVDIPVRPVRGQMIATARGGSLIHHPAFASELGYVLPKPDGTLWTGSTEEEVGFRPRTTKEGLARLQKLTRNLVPSLANEQILRSWAGLRPGSPDGRPILGPMPGWENVSIAAGHFRTGLLLAPITGMLLADQLVGVGDSEKMVPFLLSRFN